ncbi:conserved hypothetical protein [Helicobacter hepaticus ATCC 51449]|uniref:Uncharacterized protein n=1 Tax=Helicobacter hepaticus (strain ATCC 51449 / 3B1) TaxID=235279 RepID=Q7VGD1_HELHP|nr:conserved hypothetical protein [Helicobacter hepaticus ATCC 51449]
MQSQRERQNLVQEHIQDVRYVGDHILFIATLGCVEYV